MKLLQNIIYDASQKLMFRCVPAVIALKQLCVRVCVCVWMLYMSSVSEVDLYLVRMRTKL